MAMMTIRYRTSEEALSAGSTIQPTPTRSTTANFVASETNWVIIPAI
ncbi:hypothetical protein [Robertmurraya korlensis]